MTEHIYLAARYSRHLEMQDYAKELMQQGYTVTSRWIWGGHQVNDHELKSPAESEQRRRFAHEDLDDVLDADTLIFFSEPQRTPTRGGRHVEMGIAIGNGMRVMIVGEKENIFHALDESYVEHYDDWSALMLQLETEQWRRMNDDAMNQFNYLGVGLGYIPAKEEGASIAESFQPAAEGFKESSTDPGKLPYHLLSPHALRAYAEALQVGAMKPEYGERNWERGLPYSVLYSAVLRHLQDWWAGYSLDDGRKGSGMTNLGGAIFSIAALIHFESEGMVSFDDRPHLHAHLPLRMSGPTREIEQRTQPIGSWDGQKPVPRRA